MQVKRRASASGLVQLNQPAWVGRSCSVARCPAEPGVNIDVSEICAVPTDMAERRRIVGARNRRSA